MANRFIKNGDKIYSDIICFYDALTLPDITEQSPKIARKSQNLTFAKKAQR